MNVDSEAAVCWLLLSKPPPRVVAAEHKFAKRRLEHLSNCKPTLDELSTLRILVNRKAGREILYWRVLGSEACAQQAYAAMS